MRIILHLGQQKTGTTSLQHALVKDRDRLASVGTLYPDAGHARGRGGSLRPSHNAIFFTFQGNRGPALWQTQDEIAAALRDEIERTQPATLLISAEHAFMASDQGPPVLDMFDELIPGPKEVVGYLRRPDRYLISMHRQLIRLGRRHLLPLHTPERLEQLSETCQLDQSRAIGAFSARYPSVRLWNYDAVDDVVAHFYRTVLEMEPPSVSPRANPSIPAVLANLTLAHVQHNGPLTHWELQSILNFGEREPVDLLGPDNRLRIAEEVYPPHNRALGRMMGREEFFTDLDDIVAAGDTMMSVAEADETYRTAFAKLVGGDDQRHPLAAAASRVRVLAGTARRRRRERRGTR